MSETAVCQKCGGRHTLSRRSGRNGSGTSRHDNTKYCSAACKQAAYRSRRGVSSRNTDVPATTPASSVTRAIAANDSRSWARPPSPEPPRWYPIGTIGLMDLSDIPDFLDRGKIQPWLVA